jgi:putative two-component system response regulator
MKQRVLLIEDDTTMLTLLRTLLRFEGFEVEQMEGDGDLDSIVEAIRKEKPSLILLDVHLRKVNGFELFQRIRKDEELQNIRVIMSSGIDFSQKCLDEGVDCFVQKPYMPEELIRKIRDLIGGET